MTEVSGVLIVGEASPVAAAVQARAGGIPVWAWALIFVGCETAAYSLCWALTHAFNLPHGKPDDMFALGCAAALGGSAYLLGARRLRVWFYRRRLARRGTATAFPMRIELSREHLVYELGDVTSFSKWAAVTELFEVHGYWIVLVQGSAQFIPRRFFADANAERGFVGELVSQMPEAARNRSPAARKFALWE
jgi:hypothetical protein